MADGRQTTRFRFWLWLIRAIGVIVPRRLRADWRQEWEAELRCRELLLAGWDRLDWRNKLDLLRRSTSAFWDALCLQPKRLEDEMLQDLRYGVRMLLKSPGFTLIAILTLALGIGANTAMFSVVNAVLLQPLPFHEPERLVRVWRSSVGNDRSQVSFPDFADFRAQQSVFERMAAWRGSDYTLTGVGDPVNLRGVVVSSDLFPLLGVLPQLGRSFMPEEDGA